MAHSFFNRLAGIFLILVLGACSGGTQRGIADKRSNFSKFLPMEKPAAEYGLKQVRPYFRRANRAEVLRAIESACVSGRKEGSSAYNPTTQAGYYVNCNPRNRQLLNGYVPLDARRRPHEERQ
jgi:hypothetical protein